MKLKVFFVTITVIIMSLSPLTVSGETVSEEITVVAFSDFQNKQGNSAGAATINKILTAMIGDGLTKIDSVLVCGDYDVDSYGDREQNKAGIDTIKTQFSLMVKEENMLFVQGNHDCGIGSLGMCKSGNNDPKSADYGVFVINEDDYMWYNSDEERIKQTAENLKNYLDKKSFSGYEKPIFVLSHLPLHYTARTRDSGDAKHANHIFEVLNNAGEKGLNIIFLFGHNHSGGYDDYLGGACVYLAKGDSILIADGSTDKFNSFDLNFTYMNAGYVGYYNKVNDGANNTLSMTVFKIKGSQVTISRYDSLGKTLLKAAGVTNVYKNETGYTPNTKMYTSPQIINELPEYEIKDSDSDSENPGFEIDEIIPIVAVAAVTCLGAVTLIIVRRKKSYSK